jgi:hypothetical protein
MDTKIIRLKTGEDIIANIFFINNGFHLTDPMVIQLAFRGGPRGILSMAHWLPVQLIKENSVTVSISDVLTTIEPSDEMKEYYNQTVTKMKKVVQVQEESDKLTEDEINIMMEALEEREGQIVH